MAGNNHHLYLTGCCENEMRECTKHLAELLAHMNAQYIVIVITQMLYVYCPKSTDNCSSSFLLSKCLVGAILKWKRSPLDHLFPVTCGQRIHFEII